MIKTKNLVILAAVMLLLAGISFMQKSQHQKDTSGSATAIVLSGEFNKDNISRILLGYGPNPEAVVLSASNDGWIIESYHNARVNEQRISTMLRNFSNLAGEFRSDSEKVLGQYGLNDDEAITVRGLDQSGNEVLAINFGRTAEGFPGQFMRTPGSNKVYLSQTGMLSHLGIYGEPALPKVQFFLELQAIQESVPNLDAMNLVDGDQTLNFSKKFALVEAPEGSPEGAEPTTDRNAWEWLLDGEIDTDLAKTKIDGVLNSCASIRANDVADPGVSLAEYGLDNPAQMVSLTRQDGSEVVLEFGSTREAAAEVTAGTYMRIAGTKTIWVVTSYTIKNIFKNRDDLKAE
jgi:hypothetical protein